MTVPGERPYADACPGLLTPHVAEDGLLVRLRLPGGRSDVRTLSALSAAAVRFGSGALQLTSRGNVQIRGVGADALPALTAAVVAAGLLPSVSHERVRNLVASPQSGLPGHADIGDLVAALDAGLCADPDLAELPARFLFAVDDGTGDVAALGFDLAVQVLDADRALVLVGGAAHGLTLPRADAVATVLRLARRFLVVRSEMPRPAWHVREVAAESLDPAIGRVPAVTDGHQPPLGALGETASVTVPLALLTPDHVAAVAAATDAAVMITPWRGLLLPGAAAALPMLEAAGLVADEASLWSVVSACIGAPACRKSAIDTQRTAVELVGLLPPDQRRRLHLSGCERRCGSPAGDHLDLVAPVSAEVAAELVRDGEPR